jgi:hypothetical protein
MLFRVLLWLAAAEDGSKVYNMVEIEAGARFLQRLLRCSCPGFCQQPNMHVANSRTTCLGQLRHDSLALACPAGHRQEAHLCEKLLVLSCRTVKGFDWNDAASPLANPSQPVCALTCRVVCLCVTCLLTCS